MTNPIDWNETLDMTTSDKAKELTNAILEVAEGVVLWHKNRNNTPADMLAGRTDAMNARRKRLYSVVYDILSDFELAKKEVEK